MIDYLTLLLINMTAGYALLAWYVARDLDAQDQRPWIPAFGIVGLVAVTFGAHMTMTWPVIGPYNSAYGEMSVLLGVLFLAAAVSLAKRWPLHMVAWYGFFAGLAAILLGGRIMQLGMTQKPALSAIGFVLSGLAGIGAAPMLLWFRDNRTFRLAAAAVLVGAALIWAMTAYGAYWMHMEAFHEWVPLTMRDAVPPGP